MSWLFSFLGGNWLLTGGAFLIVAGLGVFAYFFRDWRAIIAAACIVGVVITIGVIDRRGYQRRTNEVIAEMQRIANARTMIITDIQATDAAQQQADTAEIARLRELIDASPANDAPCGDEGFAERVGGTP